MARSANRLFSWLSLLIALVGSSCRRGATADGAAVASASASLPANLVAESPGKIRTAGPGASAAAVSSAVGGIATTSPLRKPVPALVEAVETLVKTIGGYHGVAGVAIIDVGSGELVAASGDRIPLNPASNTKLYTAATALALLRPSFRFETALYGKRNGSSVDRLVLRGRGDPSLGSKDLWSMVHDLKASGVRRIDGDLVVDQRYFDDQFTPPAFEQQPNEWAYFRAPVSAVALNENTLTLNVRPAQSGDAAAQVWFEPAGFVDIDGEVQTTAEDRAQNVILALSPNGRRLSARVGGSVPAGLHAYSFTRRVNDPSLLAGYALKSLLSGAGISVGGNVKLAGADASSGTGAATELLAMHRSAPLSELLYELGKNSDNFYAEMLLKTLGAEKKRRPGSSAGGAEAVLDFLTRTGVVEPGTVLRNGSGLFDANRVTASETAHLLRAVYRDPAISSEYVAQLAIGGVDGTLHGRFREYRDRRIIRAKTGTLESAVALSGYVLAPPGREPVAFSILMNKVAGRVAAARAAADRCVDAIVRYLWGAEGN